MLKNYVPSRYQIEIEYRLEWDTSDDGGLTFPCDEKGEVKLDELTPSGKANYEYCVSHPNEYKRCAVLRKRVYRVCDPAHGECICGREVFLHNQYYGACQCECGRWYNLFGSEILPPEYWEEDIHDVENGGECGET